MKKQYKHLPTGKVFEQYREGGVLHNTDVTLHPFVLEGKDWKETTPNYSDVSRTLRGEIYCIKRIKDEEYFRVGDTVTAHSCPTLTITKIYINEPIDTVEVECGQHTLNLEDLIKVKEKPKEWEITAFYDKRNIQCIYPLVNGVCKWSKDRADFLESDLLSDELMAIYSVKRLSDGQEFKIGNWYKSKENSEKRQIKLITLVDEHIFFHDTLSPIEELDCRLEEAIKVEKLFTTEDGVDIYEGDKFCYIHPSYGYKMFDCVASANTDYNINPNYTKKFSSKEALEEYILMNKPCLSVNDVMDIRKELARLPYPFLEIIRRLKELAKSKI